MKKEVRAQSVRDKETVVRAQSVRDKDIVIRAQRVKGQGVRPGSKDRVINICM